jgi:outer membrane biosynthesis protein TonB
MYRICELSLNGYIDPATTRELFSKTLDVSMTIALAEVANALHNGSQLNQPTPPSKPEEAAKPKPEETAKPKPEETAKSKPEETAKPKPEETTKPKQVDTAKPIEPPSPVQSPIEESTDSRIRNFLNRKIDAIK